MADARKYFASTFITLGDVDKGPRRVTISDVAEGKYGKLNASFTDGTALGLNATNTRKLSVAYGADTTGWHGKEVEAYAGEVDYQGSPQASVLVRPISPPVTRAAAPLPPKPKNDDMNDDLPFS
jgi:hypothetical protein